MKRAQAFKDILIVEDLADVMAWLVTLSADIFSGSDIRCAATRGKAIAMLETWTPQLALIDLGLPDGSGVDVIQHLGERPSACICIVTTIFDDSEHLFGALKAGASGYLLKDDDEDIFRRQLGGILEGQPPLSASIATKVLDFFHAAATATAELTQREKEVLTFIAKGYSVRAAAEALQLSHHTVAGYCKEVYRKLHISSRAEATSKAITMGLVKAGSE